MIARAIEVHSAHAAVAIAYLALVGACSPVEGRASPDAGRADAGRDATDPFAAAATCSSGSIWDPRLAASGEMFPGRACASCHAEENAASGEIDAPLFTLAGTVFPTAHEPDDCVASSSRGATVIVTDASGRTFTVEVNASGSFFLEESVTPPYRARIAFEGRERIMQSAQHEPDCNGCHTQAGAQEAPGRILLP